MRRFPNLSTAIPPSFSLPGRSFVGLSSPRSQSNQSASFYPTLLIAVLSLASTARAIPSLTPHPHINPGVTDHDTTWLDNPNEVVPDPDPDTPDAFNHQHRDTDSLYGGNGKYIGYSAWDNNQYRWGATDPPSSRIWGHGYQASAALYQFDANFPTAGRTDFNSSVNKWEGLVNADEVNTNNVPINIKINFDPGGNDIALHWADIPDGSAIAFWAPASKEFTFDPDPFYNVVPSAGQVSVSLTATGPFLPTLTTQSANGWYYGGSGTPGTAFQIWQADAGGLITGPYNMTQYDFYTIALHELGHAWGLLHFGTGIMRTDISAYVMRTPDAGSIDGLKDLYAIPTPEPTTLAMCCIAIVGLTFERRKKRVRS